MTPAIADNKTLQEWRKTARFWTKHSDTIRTMFAPLTEALIRDAGIGEGQTVLDVAGGAGEPSLGIAERGGPAGAVTCTDAGAGMGGAAESGAQRRGPEKNSFQEWGGESLPFRSKSVGAVG